MTRKIPAFISLLSILGLVLLFNVQGAVGLTTTIRYVSPGGTDNGACSNKYQPCRSIQFAVDHAASGDEVRLAGGLYTTTSAPVADIRVALVLRGGYSTTNWDVSNKTANPTTLSVSCNWDSGEAAIEAGTSDRVAIQDLDINGCGIRSSGELLVEQVAVQNGQIRHASTANISVTLSYVTIVGGNFLHASGANSIATLTHVAISNSPADGISEMSGGKLVLSDAQVLSSTGIGIRFANPAVPSSVTRATVQGNAVGIKTASGGIVTLDHVDILSNTGRGIIDTSAGMVMNRVTIQGNHAMSDTANDDTGDGGGYKTSGGGSTLTDCVIRGNTADGNGGGIYDKGGTLVLIRTTIAGNQAELSGGGIWSQSQPTLYESAVTNNQAAAGGGVFCALCVLKLTNSAVSANTTGGIVSQNGKLVLLNSLIVGNSGGGIDVIAGNLTITQLDNTLLGLNSGGNCMITGTITGTNNLSDDGSCGFSGAPNWSLTNPIIGGLLPDGFYSMSSSSRTVDRGNPVTCPATDYRGFRRPLDGDGNGVAVCDIGPMEMGFELFLPINRR